MGTDFVNADFDRPAAASRCDTGWWFGKRAEPVFSRRLGRHGQQHAGVSPAGTRARILQTGYQGEAVSGAAGSSAANLCPAFVGLLASIVVVPAANGAHSAL